MAKTKIKLSSNQLTRHPKSTIKKKKTMKRLIPRKFINQKCSTLLGYFKNVFSGLRQVFQCH